MPPRAMVRLRGASIGQAAESLGCEPNDIAIIVIEELAQQVQQGALSSDPLSGARGGWDLYYIIL